MNRRASYRLFLSEHEQIFVELTGPAVRQKGLVGSIANISVGGLGVWLNSEADGIIPEKVFRATFLALGDNRGFTFDCKVVHRLKEGKACHCGLRFLPLADLQANEARDKALWQFLLKAQRQQARRLRNGAS